jgi:transcriptional regulator with XRE-family HTH domain
MGTPNIDLRNARVSARLSQDDLARRLETSKRQVQRWESGATRTIRPRLARALEITLGTPIEALGFPAVSDGKGGYDIQTTAHAAQPGPLSAARGNLSGIWLSRYEYPSSGRGQTLIGLHYVNLIQHGDKLSVRSLPNASSNPDSPLSMSLEVRGSVVTGTWEEQTAAGGYYRGATYFGCLQMLVDPTGRRMSGKWCGFGSDGEVNTGPWELTYQGPATKATLAEYDRPPVEAD